MPEDEEHDWLPDYIEFSTYGNWNSYLDVIHAKFLSDFVHSKPNWPGKRFSLKRHPEYEGKSATFWHIISEGSIEEQRTPDIRRCECIAWPRAIIDQFPDQPSDDNDSVLWWQNRRGREKRILLALPDFSYLVVMADRGDYIMLWTAYPVERSHQQRKLEREYDHYWKNQPS